MTGLGVFAIADRLRRCAYVERACLHQLAGWFFRAEPFEQKQRFGYHVWDHAEHVQALRQRLTLLRSGNPDVSVDPALRSAIDGLLHAPDAWCYLRASYLVVRRELIACYRRTLEDCDPAANAADIRLIRRVLPELEEQVAWAADQLRDDPDTERSGAWAARADRVVRRAGGIAGDDERRSAEPEGEDGIAHFALPPHLHFDERISDRALLSTDERGKLSPEDEVRAQFHVFFNEIYAAGMLASILYDAGQMDLPWDLVHDFSRHFWDECRHSEFGSLRLQELGSAPDRCDQVLLKYSLAMPVLHRICYLTSVLEPFYMPRKKPRFQRWSDIDARSALFADHDWSDEVNHVGIGRRWLKQLLEDDARSVRDLREEVTAILERETGEPVTSLSPF